MQHARRAGVDAVGAPLPDQVLAVNNERFTVPEVVFAPPDIGLRQAGLAQAVADAAFAAPPALHPLLLSNVLCTGGLARCPGFRKRRAADLRALVPDDIEVGGQPPSRLMGTPNQAKNRG